MRRSAQRWAPCWAGTNGPLVASGLWQRLRLSVFPVTGVAVVGLDPGRVRHGRVLGVGHATSCAGPGGDSGRLDRSGRHLPAARALRRASDHQRAARTRRISGRPVVDEGGVRASDAQVNQVLQAIGVQTDGGGNFQAGPGTSAVDPVQYLLQHGSPRSDELPARQPLLDVPVDRARVAGGPVGAPALCQHLDPPPPARLSLPRTNCRIGSARDRHFGAPVRAAICGFTRMNDRHSWPVEASKVARVLFLAPGNGTRRYS